MSTPSNFHIPSVLHLDHGFCDPEFARPSKLAVFWHSDGTRFEVAVRDAIAVYSGPGPRVETHQLIISKPASPRHRDVSIVQLHDLAELDGMPEVLRALSHFEAGRLKDAARYASAAGPRWRGLVDYFGGTAAIVASARQLLGKPVASGGHRVIVAHGNVARQSTPVYPGEAEGVVFRPDGDGGFALVARVTPEDWRRLATDHADAE